MSTFMQNCGIPVDFEGFRNARSPKDIVVFFDDFLGANFSATADAASWFTFLIEGQSTTPTILDGTDDAEDEAGGVLSLYVDATVDDGINLQVNGEAFHIADGYPLYFETRVNAASILDIDWFVGLSNSDATMEICTDETNDYLGFQSLIGTMSFVSNKDGGTKKTSDTGITEAADDWIRLAFFWDGVSKVIYSVDTDDDGIFDYIGTRDVDTAANVVPQDAMLTPVIEAIAAATGSTTLLVDYVLCMQQRFKE